MEKDEIIEHEGRRFMAIGRRSIVRAGDWYLKELCEPGNPVRCGRDFDFGPDSRVVLRELSIETSSPQPDLLAEATHALECIWAGVPDGVRKSLAESADDLRSNSIVVIPVLPEALRKVADVLARVQAARGEKS